MDWTLSHRDGVGDADGGPPKCASTCWMGGLNRAKCASEQPHQFFLRRSVPRTSDMRSTQPVKHPDLTGIYTVMPRITLRTVPYHAWMPLNARLHHTRPNGSTAAFLDGGEAILFLCPAPDCGISRRRRVRECLVSRPGPIIISLRREGRSRV